MRHGMQWSRPEISHTVRDVANIIGKDNHAAINMMHRYIVHCVDMPNCGVALQAQGNWDGTND